MSWSRCQQDKKKLVNLYNKSFRNIGGVWYDDSADRYIRFYISKKGRKGYTSFIKKHARKQVRRKNYNCPSREKGYFKRAYDLWWELW